MTTSPIDLQEKAGVAGFLELARQRASTSTSAWADNFNIAEEDVLFAYGEQWDDAAKRERMQEGRPTLTLNKMGQYIYRVVGDQRQNVQTIKFLPTNGDKANGRAINTAGTKDYSLAEVYESITRNIEVQSNAPYHYKTAFQHAVEGGFGWLRVYTDYSTQDAFDLDLVIKSVRNRWSVLMDPYAKEPDYSDANYCFISERMSKKEFEKRYPGKKVGELNGPNQEQFLNWIDDKTIKISEYFVRQPVKRTLVMMSNGETYYKDDVEPVLDELAKQNITIVRERKVQTYKVLWYKITAWDVLEGPIEWCGSTIPVVPVLGKEIAIKGQRYFRGLINDGKDAQRMLNYWQSAATERVALAPKAPWVAPAQSIENYMSIWQSANIKNWSVLPYNSIPSGERPQRMDPPPMPAAEIQLAATAEQGIKSSIGLYDVMLGNNSQEQSGRAIMARQQQGETSTYVFTDNLNLAITRIGKILCEAIPLVYDSNRIMRLQFPDGSGDFVEINKTIVDEQTGNPVVIHDLGVGKYDVVVSTGPEYSTQRQNSTDAMMELARVIPQIAQVAPDIIAENIDAPNMDIVADRLKSTLPMNMLTPEDRQKIQQNAVPPQPNPEQQMEEAKNQAQMQIQQMKVEEEKIKLQIAQAEAQTKVAELQAPKPEAESKGHDDEAQDKELIAQMIDDRLSQAFAQFIKMQRSQQQAPQQQSPQEEALEVSPQTQNPQEEATEQPGL